MNNDQKRKLLEHLLEQVKNIHSDKSSDSDFQTWKNMVERTLSKIYGDESKELEQFNRLTFSYNTTVSVPAKQFIKANRACFRRDFETAKKTISSLLEELKDYDEVGVGEKGVTKAQKIELLKILIDKSSEIKVFAYDDTVFRAWINSVERVFERVFGNNSKEIEQYKKLFQADIGFLAMNGTDVISELWKHDFDSLITMINSMIDEIGIYDNADTKALNLTKKYQVFISSTYTDLIEERQAAVEAVLKAGHIPAGMELFKAGRKQMETIKRWIDESDIYLLLLGKRYGSVGSGSKLSYTEMEYRYAIEEKKMPGFAIILDDSMSEEKIRHGKKHEEVYEVQHEKEYRGFEAFVKTNVVSFAKTLDGIKTEVLANLNKVDNEYNLIGWIRSDAIPMEQITAYGKQYPSLSIQFNNDEKYEKHHTFIIKSVEEYDYDQEKINIENLRQSLTSERISADKAQDFPINSIEYSRNKLLLAIQPSEEEYERYNKELDLYIDMMRVYYNRYWQYEEKMSRLFKIELSLKNDGTVPVEDIDISLHFPDGFEMLDDDAIPNEPKEPEKPQKPRTSQEMMMSNMPFFPLQKPSLVDYTFAESQQDNSPTISKTHSYDITFPKIEKLKHTLVEPLAPLYLFYADKLSIKPFSFTYRILSDNHPKPFEGTLNIVFEQTKDGEK